MTVLTSINFRTKPALITSPLHCLYIIWEQCFWVVQNAQKVEKSKSTLWNSDSCSFTKWSPSARFNCNDTSATPIGTPLGTRSHYSQGYGKMKSLTARQAQHLLARQEKELHWDYSAVPSHRTKCRTRIGLPFHTIFSYPICLLQWKLEWIQYWPIFVSSRNSAVHLGPYSERTLNNLKRNWTQNEK